MRCQKGGQRMALPHGEGKDIPKWQTYPNLTREVVLAAVPCARWGSQFWLQPAFKPAP